MKCPLKIVAPIDVKYCISYLPDRLMFKSFGLSSFNSLISTFEYGLSAGYIHFANLERDCSSLDTLVNAQKTKDFCRRFLRKPLRLHLKNADRQITTYEKNNALLEEYILMVGNNGQELF
ncbi:MAG: hypothetical protein KKB31_05310, partial [Nanoarchaeota archaeon]|nr:hypothetical protein [Nanoarchaeota archaeon]